MADPGTDPPFVSDEALTGPRRPGPDRIEPGTCPGGIVMDVYAVPSNVRVIRQTLRPGDDIESAATMAAQLNMPGWAACLVAYDGDTGDRYPPGAWLAAMLQGSRTWYCDVDGLHLPWRDDA